MWARRALILSVLCLAAPAALAQVYVTPQRAYQAQVRRFSFDWSYIDVDADEGGLRLYFYEREREIAELAVPLILEAYDDLRQKFAYSLTERFPYILYNTYQEFLETKLFPLQEGVLGVTSPIDLTLTLPYFGDHRRFVEVSKHELVHQFTIQKLKDLARAKDKSSPIDRLPLWFIEGLAEHYSRGGLDDETEMLARDLVTNPDAERGYVLLDFFEDRPYSGLWTYKLGQARVFFLEEVFGAGTLQRILDEAHRLSGGDRIDFAKLLEHVTGDDRRTLGRRFAAWLKQRSFASYLDATQPATAMRPLFEREESSPILGFATSPDGNLLLYRRMAAETGQTQLVLMDRRDPRSARKVRGDGVPGAESLHPASVRNFALGYNCLAYVAQVDSRDVIYWQAITREEEVEARPDQEPPAPLWSDREVAPALRVRLVLGEEIMYDLGELVGAESPALSPDGLRIAFIGIDERGVRDLYLIEPGADGHSLRRLTDDLWAERELSFGQAGIVYTSNATSNYRFNLFGLDPDDDHGPAQLTYEDRDVLSPLHTHDGRTYFVAFDRGRADVYELADDEVVRRTDVATGITGISPGFAGGLSASWLHGGVEHLVHIAREDLLELASTRARLDGEPEPLARAALDAASPYRAKDLDNWRPGSMFGLLGIGGGAVVGQLYASASDLMRDHVLVLNLTIWGSMDLTDGTLLYINQKHRLGYGVGAFHALSYRFDRTLATPDDLYLYTAYERFYGGLGLLRVPMSRFRYLSASLALGGVSRTATTSLREGLVAAGALDAWQREHARAVPQAEVSVSFGHDTVRYHPLTGPLDGGSLLLQLTGGAQPERAATFGEARLDVARYIALGGSANLALRAGVGGSLGGELAREFFLSGFDTLRGVGFNDTDYLLGRYFYFGTTELQLPLSSIVRVIFLPNIEAVFGVDFGGVANDTAVLWDKRVLDFVLGANFVIGPIVLRLHFAKPVDTGARPERAGIARPLGQDWVTNLSLNWLDF